MAKNSIGESISREARMTVLHADTNNEFSQISQDLEGHISPHVDDELNFIVMHCITNEKVLWTFNNQPVPESEHVRIYENGTLIINFPIEEDEGNYKCEVTNHVGAVSTIASYKISGEILNNFHYKF